MKKSKIKNIVSISFHVLESRVGVGVREFEKIGETIAKIHTLRYILFLCLKITILEDQTILILSIIFVKCATVRH